MSERKRTQSSLDNEDKEALDEDCIIISHYKPVSKRRKVEENSLANGHVKKIMAASSLAEAEPPAAITLQPAMATPPQIIAALRIADPLPASALPSPTVGASLPVTAETQAAPLPAIRLPSLAIATPGIDPFQWLNTLLSQDCHPGMSYSHLSILGTGSFGEVWKGKNSINTTVALKYMPWPSTKQKVNNIIAEILHLKKCNHPNIPQYFECFKLDNAQICLVMEYIEGANVCNWLGDSRLHPLAIAGICSQLVKALEYLHHNAIIHCDVKPDNVMVRRDGHVYLCDLGLSQVEGQNFSDQRGTPYYMAPEVWALQTFTCKVDVWSLGMTLVEMWTAKAPYLGMENDQIKLCVMNNIARPVIEEIMPHHMMTFLNKCLKWDVSHRATASELIHHEFLRPINWCASECVRNNLQSSSSRAPSAAAKAAPVSHDVTVRPANTVAAPGQVLTVIPSNGVGVPHHVMAGRPTNIAAAPHYALSFRHSHNEEAPHQVLSDRPYNAIRGPHHVMTAGPSNAQGVVRPMIPTPTPRHVMINGPTNVQGAPRLIMTRIADPLPASALPSPTVGASLPVTAETQAAAPHYALSFRHSHNEEAPHQVLSDRPYNAIRGPHHVMTAGPSNAQGVVRPMIPTPTPRHVMINGPTNVQGAPRLIMTRIAEC